MVNLYDFILILKWRYSTVEIGGSLYGSIEKE